MVTRHPLIYKEAFKGSFSDELCDKIDDFLNHVENVRTPITSLKNTIFEMSNESIEQIIRQKNSKGVDIKLGELRDNQTFGLMFMLMTKNGVLGDSVGLGKTSQIASLINYSHSEKLRETGDSFRFIFLTEKGLVEQTRKELIRFTGRYVMQTTGEAKKVQEMIKELQENDDNFFGIVANYSVINSYEFMRYMNKISKEKGIDYLFVDESEVLQNKSTITTKHMTSLRDMCDHRYLMTANLFGGTLLTAHSQLDFVQPNFIPTKTAFEKAFVRKHHITNSILGYKDPEAFKKAVRYIHFKQTRNEIGVHITNSKCSLYLYNPLDYQKKLVNRTSVYDYVFEDPTWFGEEFTYSLQTVPKARLVLDICQKFPYEQVIIYCKHKEAQSLLKGILEDHGMPTIILNGDVNTAEKKAKVIDEFRASKKVLITNIMRGLNLKEVNHIIFYSWSANSGFMTQVEGRAVRELNINKKNMHILSCNLKEYEYILRARKHFKDVSNHTKEEVSLISKFMLNHVLELQDEVKDLLKGNSYAVYEVTFNGDEEEVKTWGVK